MHSGPQPAARNAGSETIFAAEDIRRLSDEQLWQMRNIERKKLIDRVRKRYARQLASGHDHAQDFTGSSMNMC